MKKTTIIALVFALALLFGGSQTGVEAQAVCPGAPRGMGPVAGFQQLTVSTVAVTLTVPNGSFMAIAVVQDADVRYRDDFTAPTATVGTLVINGQGLLICKNSLTNIQFIRDAGVDAVLNVSYYG